MKYDVRVDCKTGFYLYLRDLMSKDKDWMNEPTARRDFLRSLDELDAVYRPWTDAIAEGERLTEKDLSLVVNC